MKKYIDIKMVLILFILSGVSGFVNAWYGFNFFTGMAAGLPVLGYLIFQSKNQHNSEKR